MKVLFAIGNAAVSEEVKKQYFELYGDKLEGKDVFYFKAILEEVKRDKSYDRIVIAEQLEPMQNNIVASNDQIIFNNIDSITDEIDNSVIIFICADNRTRNDSLMSRLFNIGIYNILMGDERQPKQLCNLIKEPRNKKEAKDYLRNNPALAEESVVIPDEGVDERELLNILNYFDRLKSREEILNSFTGVAEQYNDEDLTTIVASLTKKLKKGPEIFEILKEDPRYSKYCKWDEKMESSRNDKPGIFSFFKTKKTFSDSSDNMKKMISNKKNEDTNPIHSDNDKVDSNSSSSSGLSQEDILRAEEEEKLRIQQEQIRRQREELKAQQEALERAQQEASMKAQQEAAIKAQQEAAIKVQQEAAIKAQQEAMMKAQQEAAMKAQQEEMLKAQQEAAMKAQQEAMMKAQQEAAMKAQQEEMLKAQQEAAMKAQQEAMMKAQQEAMKKAQQEATMNEQQNAFAKQPTQEEIIRAQQEENLRKQQEQIQREREELRARQEAYRMEEEQSNSIMNSTSAGTGMNTKSSKDKFSSVPIQKDLKKVIAMVGTNKVGTSFMANCLGTLLSQNGAKVAILDITKSKGLYWFYGDETRKKHDVVSTCMSNLSNGIAAPIHVGKNKNLDLYTSVPGGDGYESRIYKHRSILDTAKRSCDVLIIDCDFETPYEYFEQAQEVYIVQDFDLVKVQETVGFLKELKNNQIDWSKLRVIINNSVKCSINAKKIIKGAFNYYSDPTMTYTEEFEEIKQYVEFYMEQENYTNYIDSMENGKLSIEKFTPSMRKSLNELVSMIYGNAPKKKGLFG